MKSFVAKGSAKGLRMWSQRVAGVSIGIYIYFWKSKGLSDKNTTAPKKNKIKLHILMKIVNIYIVYEISKNYKISSYPTL